MLALGLIAHPSLSGPMLTSAPSSTVPKFALLASRGERLPVHGDGSATRSYLHVFDVAEAFDIILHKASGRATCESIAV